MCSQFRSDNSLYVHQYYSLSVGQYHIAFLAHCLVNSINILIFMNAVNIYSCSTLVTWWPVDLLFLLIICYFNFCEIVYTAIFLLSLLLDWSKNQCFSFTPSLLWRTLVAEYLVVEYLQWYSEYPSGVLQRLNSTYGRVVFSENLRCLLPEVKGAVQCTHSDSSTSEIEK